MIFLKQEEKSKESKEYIIRCAIDEFAAQKGKTSLNNICKTNHISKGKMYHHFSSKLELLCECVSYCLRTLADDILSFEVNPELSIERNFHNYFLQRVNYIIKNTNHLVVIRYGHIMRLSDVSDKSNKMIFDSKQKWNEAVKSKVLEILHICKDKIRITDDEISDLFLMMYENSFYKNETNLIKAVQKGDYAAAKEQKHLMQKHHDNIIKLTLYGMFVREKD